MALTGRFRRRLADPAVRIQVAGTALVVLAGVLAVPAMGWVDPVAQAAQQRELPQAVTTLDAPCTRIIEGLEWVFDPCIPEGEPLPQDVLDQLEEVRRERECQSTTATTPPTGTTTWSPPPPTTDPTTTSTWSPPPPTETSNTWSPPPTSWSGPASVASSWPSPPPTTSWSPPPPTTWPSPTTTWPSPPPTTWPTTTETTAPTLTEPPPTTTTAPTTTTWTCPTSPTETTTTPPSTTTEPTETTQPTDPLPPTEPPGDCTAEPARAPGPAPLDEMEDKRREARGDRIDCRNPNNIPDRGNPVVLVATGDSVTSAHHQWGFGTGVCNRTSFDFRNLPGNHAKFSYVGRYFDNLDPNVIEYYNFARTGFSTADIRGAAAGTLDGCNNRWGRAFPPLALADAVVRKAKADGHKAYFVTTGGVNNTNWVTVLQQLVKCRGMEFVQNAVPRSTFTWNAIGGRAGIVTNGGGCTLRVRNFAIFGQDFFHRIGVPRYNGGAQAAAITADATAIVNAMLAAGADKIVWMLYYDITPANVDIANFGWLFLRDNAPAWVAGLIPPRIAPNNQPLIDPMWVGAVRLLINNLNAAVTAGIPANRKVRAQAAPGFLAADIQNTAIGGSPHPSAAGHTKLSNTLNAAFRAL